MFEELIGRRVRIIKSDNFTKVGTLLGVEKDFLKLEMDGNGAPRVEYIAISAVTSVTRVAI